MCMSTQLSFESLQYMFPFDEVDENRDFEKSDGIWPHAIYS
jgi:hypothetical protein